MQRLGKHQQWKLSLHAQARGFHLRLRVSRALSCWGAGGEARFSVVVRFRGLLLKMRSGRSTSDSRLVRLVRGVLRRLWRPRRIASDVLGEAEKPGFHFQPGMGRFHWFALRRPAENGVSCPFWEPTKGLLGSLSLLSPSASHRDHGEVIVHAVVSLLYLILPSKVSLARSARSPVALAVLFASLGVLSLSYLHSVGQVSEATWMLCFGFLAFASLLPLARCQAGFNAFLNIKRKKS